MTLFPFSSANKFKTCFSPTFPFQSQDINGKGKRIIFILIKTNKSYTTGGAAHPKLLQPIFAHHTKAVKLLLNLPRASHLSQTLHHFNILKPEQLIMREHVKLAHSHRMKRLPQPISNILTPVGRSLEARQNRYSENNLELPGPSVIAGRHFPAYKIAKAWNNLPHSIKSITLHDFEAGFAAHTANLNDRVCEKPNCPICD